MFEDELIWTAHQQLHDQGIETVTGGVATEVGGSEGGVGEAVYLDSGGGDQLVLMGDGAEYERLQSMLVSAAMNAENGSLDGSTKLVHVLCVDEDSPQLALTEHTLI